jgi:hypothetical protein
LQFFAGLLVQIAELQDELKLIRLGFNIAATTTMINTYVGTHGGSFAYLEWYLVSALVLSLPLFVITPFGTIVSTSLQVVQANVKQTWNWPSHGDDDAANENLGSREHVQNKVAGLSDGARNMDDDSAMIMEILKPWLADPLGLGYCCTCFILSFETRHPYCNPA